MTFAFDSQLQHLSQGWDNGQLPYREIGDAKKEEIQLTIQEDALTVTDDVPAVMMIGVHSWFMDGMGLLMGAEKSSRGMPVYFYCTFIIALVWFGSSFYRYETWTTKQICI